MSPHSLVRSVFGQAASVMAVVGLRASLLPGYVIGGLVLSYAWEHAGEIVPGWNVALTRSLSLLGGALGWIGGIVALPETPWQSKRFAQVFAVLSTFVGGALFAKFIESLGNFTQWRDNQFARFLLFALWFAVGLLFTAAPRIDPEREKQLAESDQSKAEATS